MISMGLRISLLLIALAIVAGFVVCSGADQAIRREGNQNRAGACNPEPEYLKAVNSVGSPQDPPIAVSSYGRIRQCQPAG